MQFLARARRPWQLSHGGQDLLRLGLIISFPVIGLDQFLRTTPAQFSAQPVVQAEHWVTGSLMALPLFAAGIWAGDWIANRAGLGVAERSGIFKRALVIALLVAITLLPVWFVRNKADNLAWTQALVTPHSHGSVDVYWVAPGVILALVCVCLVPAAIWAGRSITTRLAIRLPHGAGAFARASVPVLLVAAVPVLAWLLHLAAERAYASQENNTSALLAVHVHSHAFYGGGHRSRVPAGPPVTAAPFAFAYQIAHALQDGLAGQATGYPVAVMALWTARGPRGRNQRRQQISTGGTGNEPALEIKPKGPAENWRVGRSGSGDRL
jgi:hypothetical protein